jgi:hypothetical protein
MTSKAMLPSLVGKFAGWKQKDKLHRQARRCFALGYALDNPSALGCFSLFLCSWP